MRLLLIILFSLIGLTAYSQTYSRDGLGIKWIQLEGCRKVSNGQPADSCFVMTNGINGKLSRCLHISELRALITGGVGPTDSTYLVDNLDGSYSLFNENGTEYPFGYKFEEVGDTIFLTDLDGHRADTLVMSLLDNQTLSWDPGTGDLGIANGNTVNLDGRYLLSEVDGDPTNELQFVDSFYTSNDSLFISLDRDSVAPSYVVLNPGADGNGIYGGSGEVPNNTYAHVPLTNDFAIGHFRSFPGSVETSDRGLWLSGDEFYLYANDSTSGGLARIYTSNLDIINVSTLDSAESYFHVDPDRATVFSEDGINATNITARPDSLDMYSRLWTPEFDSARLRLETTYGNPGDVLTSDGMYMRWATPTAGFTLDSVILRLSGNVLESKVNTTSDTSLVISEHTITFNDPILTSSVNGITDTALISISGADGNGIYGGSDMVPDQTYAQIGTFAPHSNAAQDSIFAIGYHPLFPNASLTNSRGLYWGSTGSTFLIMGADTANNSYTYTNYTSSQYSTSRNSSTGEISEVNIGPAYVNYDVYDATDTSMIDILLDSIDMSSMKLHANVDTLRLKINGSYGAANEVLTADGNGNAEWQPATGGAQANAIDLSGNVITSNVDGQIDTTLAVGNNTLSYGTSTKILTSSVNGVSDTTTLTGLGDVLLGGNTNGADMRIGTNDGFDLFLETNNAIRFTIYDDGTDAGKLEQTAVTTTTNALDPSFDMYLNSNGTAAANFGPSIRMFGESSTTNNRRMAQFGTYWTTATDASRQSAFTIQLPTAGSNTLVETFKLDRTNSGATGLLSIGTASPITINPTTVQTTGTNSLTLAVTNGGNRDVTILADTTYNSSNGTVKIYGAGTSGTDNALTVENMFNSGSGSVQLMSAAGYSKGTAFESSLYEKKMNRTTTDGARYEIQFWDDSDWWGSSAMLGCKFTRAFDYGDLYLATRSANGYSPKIYILQTGQIGFGEGASTSPSAWAHLAAGTATASTAPLKFTSGTNLATAESGAMEYDGTNFYMTNSTPTRCYAMKALVGSGTLDFGNTAAQNSADLTITVTGAADGEEVILGVPNASVNANSAYTAWVSAANTVTVRFNNYSAIAIDPASATFKVSVIKR